MKNVDNSIMKNWRKRCKANYMNKSYFKTSNNLSLNLVNSSIPFSVIEYIVVALLPQNSFLYVTILSFSKYLKWLCKLPLDISNLLLNSPKVISFSLNKIFIICNR